ncbi:MAG: class I SAM-dependent methyltransferase [Acidimicrobiales bacterium]
MDHARKEALAAAGFADGPLYAAARPDYPRAALEYFAGELRLGPSTRALDLGAGTGIFSRQVLPFVGRLTAVDPSASMRQTMRSATPDVEILEGRDVAIPLANRSVDVVFVAQAFHWFDATRALVEIHRVLTPGGGLGLIWNERDESVDWVGELGRAMRWTTDRPYQVGTDFAAVVVAGPFTGVRRATFAHSQTLSRDGLCRRVRSTSYIAALDERDREALMTRVAAVVERLAEPIVLPYVTDVYCATAIPGSPPSAGEPLTATPDGAVARGPAPSRTARRRASSE